MPGELNPSEAFHVTRVVIMTAMKATTPTRFGQVTEGLLTSEGYPGIRDATPSVRTSGG